MEALVQWATILSPLIAVAIAWWMTKNSAKDTADKIACIKESTDREIESIKRLAKIQIETTQLQISTELWQARAKLLQNNDKIGDMLDMERSSMSYQAEFQPYVNRQQKKKDLSYDREFLQEYAKVLGQKQTRLTELSKQLEDE